MKKTTRALDIAKCFAALLTISFLFSSCATSIKTTVRNDSELAAIRSFAAVEVDGLRDSSIISKALVSSLREKGFTVEKAAVEDEDALELLGLKMGVDAIIHGYITRADRHTRVTDGKERIRTRETSTGTKETIRYDPPEVITSKTIYVRLKALDGLNGYVIWDSEGHVTGDSGKDTVYMIEALVAQMVQELADPPADPPADEEPTGPETVAVGGSAPDFTTRSVDDQQITLSDYRGDKIVVLNFWGIRCLPCLQEMPKLEVIYRKYKGQGMEMLGVNVDGVGGDIIKKNLRKQLGDTDLNVTYPLLLDENFEIIDAYYLTVAPLTAIIDKNGIIQYMHVDYQAGDEIELEEMIKKVLEQD